MAETNGHTQQVQQAIRPEYNSHNGIKLRLSDDYSNPDQRSHTQTYGRLPTSGDKHFQRETESLKTAGQGNSLNLVVYQGERNSQMTFNDKNHAGNRNSAVELDINNSMQDQNEHFLNKQKSLKSLPNQQPI